MQFSLVAFGQTPQARQVASFGPGQYAVTEPVLADFCAQPAVDQDGPLYVAYRAGNAVRFLVGVDIDPVAPSGVDFFQLCSAPTEPGGEAPPVAVPLNVTGIRDYVPGNFGGGMGTVPQLAVDPSNPDRLYIVYQDVLEGTTDVNVYIHALTRNHSYWELGPKVQVNNDETQYESDQFLPSVVVDGSGRLHVIFYDDRRFNVFSDQDDDCQNPKFDAYYASSTDQGATWQNTILFENPNDPGGPTDPPALDCTVQRVNPREYIAICWYGSESVSEIWTAYTGASELDQLPNKALMWSSLIGWTP